VSKGFARWEWVRENHKSPTNPDACIKLLGSMSDDEWPLFQWVCTPPDRGGPRSISRKKRVLEADSYQILAKGAYLKFLPEWRAKLREDERPKNGAAKPRHAPKDDPAGLAQRRYASALPFVLAQLEDEKSEKKREEIRARFAALHPNMPLPWDEGGGLQPAEATP